MLASVPFVTVFFLKTHWQVRIVESPLISRCHLLTPWMCLEPGTPFAVDSQTIGASFESMTLRRSQGRLGIAMTFECHEFHPSKLQSNILQRKPKFCKNMLVCFFGVGKTCPEHSEVLS